MIVLVCGGRYYNEQRRLHRALDAFHAKTPIDLLVHGDATGADLLADVWARQVGVDRVKYPANWKRYGKAGGPIRNKRMLERERPDVVIWFPGGDGTNRMKELASAAGVRLINGEAL